MGVVARGPREGRVQQLDLGLAAQQISEGCASDHRRLSPGMPTSTLA